MPGPFRKGILLGPRIDIAGEEYGKLRVLRYDRAGYWICRCEPELGGCGAERPFQGGALRKGRQRSCGAPGCHLPTSPTKHGHAPASGQSPTYGTYRNLVSRHSGRLGAAWLGPDGFLHFLADMGPKPDRHRLEIDDDGLPIGPSNCRWVPAGVDRRIEIGRRKAAGEATADLMEEYGVSRQWISRCVAEAMRADPGLQIARRPDVPDEPTGTAGYCRGEDCHLARLDDDDVHAILRRLKAGEHPDDIAPDFGVTVTTVYSIGAGRTWRHIWMQYEPIVIARRKPGLSAGNVEMIRRYLAGERIAALAADHGVSRQRVHQILDAWRAAQPAMASPHAGCSYSPLFIPAGKTLECRVHGRMRVAGTTDAPLPWPYSVVPGGKRRLIVTGDLERAIRTEAAVFVAEQWEVSRWTVRDWRRALGVPRFNEGTTAEWSRMADAKFRGE
jgi:hypothetical protein